MVEVIISGLGLFTGPKMFCAAPNFWASPKIYLHIVAVTNILCQIKRWFAFSKIGFCTSTKVFEEALNTVRFLSGHKIFGAAQNILGPVKGKRIRVKSEKVFVLIFDKIEKS